MKSLLAILAALATTVVPAAAATTNIDAFSRGCLNSDGSAGCGNSGTASGNYFTGTFTSAGGAFLRRSFFLFDLSGIGDPVIGARLQISQPSSGFFSPTGTESVGFFELSSTTEAELATLQTVTPSTTASTFSALGTGINLGGPTVTSADLGTIIDLTLGSSWLNALNSNAGQSVFGVGGSIITLDGAPSEFVFADTGFGSPLPRVRLVVETKDMTPVPLPAAAWMLIAGLGGIAAMRRCHKKS